MEPDPRFPDRPQHKDFERLSKLAQEQDHYSFLNDDIEGFLSPFVDVDSLTYLARGRGESACEKALGVDVPGILREAFSDFLAGAIIDGFALGVRFQGV